MMNTETDENHWFDNETGVDDSGTIDQYEITSTPNDFNILTIGSYLENGAIVLPVFQRNFTWDKARASKFIESLLLGLPVPQTFLYEESRNKYLILDGQQRLMSIYFFIKGKFPYLNKRASIKKAFMEHNKIPDSFLYDKDYFQDFDLSFPKTEGRKRSIFEGLNYNTLADYKTSFDLRPVRNVIIKQNEPKDDNSSIYEIYDRLNTGGVSLKPQEIRSNLYRSDFYRMLYELNADGLWRSILGKQDEDGFMRDVELLLRSFALLVWGDKYAPSMTNFLNKFSNYAKRTFTATEIKLLKDIFTKFANSVPIGCFLRQGKFSIALFESAFVGKCSDMWKKKYLEDIPPIGAMKIEKLSNTLGQFLQEGTTKQKNVEDRLKLAREIMGGND